MARESALSAGLAALFPTGDPSTAARSRTGAILTAGREAPDTETGANWLPLVAVGLAVAVLALAVVQNPGRGLAGRPLDLPYSPQEEASYENESQAAPGGW